MFVDGGYIELGERSDDFDVIWEDLAPPKLTGTPIKQMRRWISSGRPHWTDEAIEGTMGNFEHLENGTVKPWLALENHKAILRAMWMQRPRELYPLIEAPVLICPVVDGAGSGEPSSSKQESVAEAERLIPQARTQWFYDTVHDVHQDKPEELVGVLLEFARQI